MPVADKRPFSEIDSFRDHDATKFVGDLNDKTAIRVVDTYKDGWARVDVAYPIDTIEVFSYKDDSLTTLLTVTITYATSAKNEILSVVRS